MSDRNDDDLTSLLAKREHARPNRLTWVLMTLLILVVGFIGGAVANQKFGTSGSRSTGAAGFPTNLPAGFTGGLPGIGQTGGSTATAQGGGSGAFGNATFGTVTLVDGTNLYITTPAGATVKVKVPDSAKVTSQTSVALSDLPSGATVIVRGDKAADGTVTATAVSEGALPGGSPPGAQGVTATNSTPTPPGGN
jgi:hypothetical protein